MPLIFSKILLIGMCFKCLISLPLNSFQQDSLTEFTALLVRHVFIMPLFLCYNAECKSNLSSFAALFSILSKEDIIAKRMLAPAH